MRTQFVTVVRCQNIGFKFEGFRVFLYNYDEGIGLFFMIGSIGVNRVVIF